MHAVSALDDMYRAFAAALSESNRQCLLRGKPVPRDRDPRDLADHIESMLAGRRTLGAPVDMQRVEALGALVFGLGLAVQRVEDGRSELGDAA